MKENTTKKDAKRDLYLTMLESTLGAGLLCMAIMTPFFNSIGLSQEEIALTQVIFTVVVSVLNIPAGWIADRFSRKWANIIGDIGTFFVFLAYANVHGIVGAIICESLLGVLMAFSQGVDISLLRHFCYKVVTRKSETVRKNEEAEKFFKKKTARLAFWQYVCTLILLTLGGPIGAIDYRLAIALSGVPSLIGGIVSIFIHDDSEKLQTNEKPIKDMVRVVKDSVVKNTELRRRICVYAIGRELTHGIIWVATPIFLLAGVPLSIVSLAWAINSVTCIIGSLLASRYANRLNDRWIFAVPLILCFISMGVLSISINIFTVGIYFLMGIVQGWTNATLMPMVQRYAKPAEQTSVVSIAKVAGQLLYIPIVMLIGWAADINLQLAPAMTLAIFMPLGIIFLAKLKNEHKTMP